jgi:DivIVA domain-containing protein
MGVDQTSLDRIRNATFPSSRRGYDKHEVEKFLARLADWLETGGGDESRSDTVKRELERVGQRTGAILAQAEESAQQIRSEAEDEARETITAANAQAEKTRSEADSYANETRGSADAYGDEQRRVAEKAAAEASERTEQDAQEAIEAAEQKAQRIVHDGIERREDIEAVIADLVRHRDDVLVEAEELSARLTAAVSENRPAAGSDPFDKPDELDPLEREDEELEWEDRGEDLEADAQEELEIGDESDVEEEEPPAKNPPPKARRLPRRRVQA